MVKEYIFLDNQPFASCHASTLIVLDNDEVLAAWFGGTEEAHHDVAIWISRRSQDGVWSEPFKLLDEAGLPHWNPVLFQNKEGRIFLYYKVGITEEQWYTLVITSDDNGYRWTEPKELVEGDIGGRGPVKNKPIYLVDGTIVAPNSIELDRDYCIVDLSYDDGETWVQSEAVPIDYTGFEGAGVIQPTVWESTPGNLHMLMRSSESVVFQSDSVDGGKTWSQAYKIALPNNNSGFDLVRMGYGNLVLAYNPVGANWGPRTPLVLAVSSDNGKTWSDELMLEGNPGEFSYPAIVAKGKTIYLTYTWNRTRIVFWKINADR